MIFLSFFIYRPAFRLFAANDLLSFLSASDILCRVLEMPFLWLCLRPRVCDPSFDLISNGFREMFRFFFRIRTPLYFLYVMHEFMRRRFDQRFFRFWNVRRYVNTIRVCVEYSEALLSVRCFDVIRVKCDYHVHAVTVFLFFQIFNDLRKNVL